MAVITLVMDHSLDLVFAWLSMKPKAIDMFCVFGAAHLIELIKKKNYFSTKKF